MSNSVKIRTCSYGATKKASLPNKRIFAIKKWTILFFSIVFWVVTGSMHRFKACSQSRGCIDKERSIMTVQVMAPYFIQFCFYLPHIFISLFQIYREFNGKLWLKLVYVCFTNSRSYLCSCFLGI